MGWSEAIRLYHVLAVDPSSAVAAAVQGWEHPFSYEAMVLADLFDVQYASKSKRKPKPWRRPWARKDKTVQKRGRAVSIEEFEAMRRRAFGRKSREVGVNGW